MREVSRLVLAPRGARTGGDTVWQGRLGARCGIRGTNAGLVEGPRDREAHALRRAAWARVQVVRGRRGEVVSMARSGKEGGPVVPWTKCSSARRKVLTPREVWCGVKGRWASCEGVAALGRV